METVSLHAASPVTVLLPTSYISPLPSSSGALFASSPQGTRRLLTTFTHKHSRFPSPSIRTPRCCKGSSDSANEEISSMPKSLDRRQLLLASTLGISYLPLVQPHYALGAPVQPPDFKSCTSPIDPGNGAASVDCCLPVSATISDFKVPDNLPMRVRKPAHLASSDYIAKYNEAYKRLRALPADDPRQYTLQANVHCAFCDAAYDENGTEIEYQVHNSWLFFPWHRWYLYFHERILATLIKDDTFALPFWNWDSAAGYTMPAFYVKSQSSLYDSNRDASHLPPKVVDLNYNLADSGLSNSAQLAANNTLMYRQMVTNAKTPSLFFGQAYRQGDAASPGAGTVENTPHGTVHVWTGSPSNPNYENMGALYSASRDPIFYSHHSNVDRLWQVWKGLGGRRKDFTDTDWLDATFLFYDEKAELVRVKIRDALEPAQLFYKYEEVPNDWLKAAPKAKKSRSTATAMLLGTTPATAMAVNFKDLKEFKARGTKKVEKIISALVKRPKKVKADDYEEEILVLDGVEIPSDERVKFDVFINLPDADEKEGSDISEFAGSFFNVPHMGMKMGKGKRTRKSQFRLGIGEVLKELGIESDDSFSITIVPRSKTSIPISIDDVKLEYE